jgi:hypothetical protein
MMHEAWREGGAQRPPCEKGRCPDSRRDLLRAGSHDMPKLGTPARARMVIIDMRLCMYGPEIVSAIAGTLSCGPRC